MKQVLIVDNYDSFTYNLVHSVETILGYSVTVKKNDALVLSELADFEYFILSPGPGLPQEAGALLELIEAFGPTKKFLGVCLGLQAIAEAYGCQLKNLKQVYHGIRSKINVTAPQSKLYKHLPQQLMVGRYHSWVLDEATLSQNLIVSARDENGTIMSIEDPQRDVFAVQYHPESIMTDQGIKLLENFLAL